MLLEIRLPCFQWQNCQGAVMENPCCLLLTVGLKSNSDLQQYYVANQDPWMYWKPIYTILLQVLLTGLEENLLPHQKIQKRPG